jgi:hypothetical protein
VGLSLALSVRLTPRLTLPPPSHMSTPVKRRYGGTGAGGGGGGGGGGGAGSGSGSHGRDYGPGQINAYPPTNPAPSGAAGAVMMSLAEELLTKKGLSLKHLQEDQEEYAETGDKARALGESARRDGLCVRHAGLCMGRPLRAGPRRGRPRGLARRRRPARPRRARPGSEPGSAWL